MHGRRTMYLAMIFLSVVIIGTSPRARALNLSAVDDFAYQLQDVDLEALGRSKCNLIVMDYSADGSDDTRCSRDEIDALQDSPGGNKIVLSYMSIGEAETYRWYWQRRSGDNSRQDPKHTGDTQRQCRESR